jgi:hypothetical protein
VIARFLQFLAFDGIDECAHVQPVGDGSSRVVAIPSEHVAKRNAVVSRLAGLGGPPAADFTGGEFVLTEQRPRVEVVSLARRDAVVFAVDQVQGKRGLYRVKMRESAERKRVVAGCNLVDAADRLATAVRPDDDLELAHGVHTGRV